MEHETRSKPAIAHQPRPAEHQGVGPRSLSAPCHASAAAACCSAASSTLRSSVTAVCDARYRRSLMDLHSQQRTRETHTRQHMGHGQRGVCACWKRQDSKCGCRHAHWRQSGARGAHSPITPRWLSGSDASGRGWGKACRKRQGKSRTRFAPLRSQSRTRPDCAPKLASRMPIGGITRVCCGGRQKVRLTWQAVPEGLWARVSQTHP